jgi:hypothetical protein
MGKSNTKDFGHFSKVDPRISAMVSKLAGDKIEDVLLLAWELTESGKQPERALADALEKYKLV